MGRPREHDETTRAALVDAAERLVAEGGQEALSVRAVAQAAGTTTRAVYSLFGSREGLVSALAARAFEFLAEGVAAVPETDEPVSDLMRCGVEVYRTFVREHPSLFRIAFQRIVPDFVLTEDLAQARAGAFAQLERKVRRVQEAGLLERRSVRAAAVEFNAMCEGLANAELRGGTLRVVPDGEEDRVWRDAFESLLHGLLESPR